MPKVINGWAHKHSLRGEWFFDEVEPNGFSKRSVLVHDCTERVFTESETRAAERIACSAIWFYDGKVHPHQPINVQGGLVVCGLGHHHIFNTLASLGVENYKDVDHSQGFLTTWNRFIGRAEAAVIAQQCGQLANDQAKLYSEDIFYKRLQ